MTVYAETDRLLLRSLKKDELPRLVSLLGDWEVVKWLDVVPFPYTLGHAQELFDDVSLYDELNEPQFFAVASRRDNRLIGGIGMHEPRNHSFIPGQIEVGYWLGKDHWGQGFMREAVSRAIDLGFARPQTHAMSASTSRTNVASQKILEHSGLRNQGLCPRDYVALRGDDEIIKWILLRDEYEGHS